MENYGINHERVSDYGLRKILCLKTSGSKNFGCNATPIKDTYMFSRKKQQLNEKKKFYRTLSLVGAAVGLATLSNFLVKKMTLLAVKVKTPPKNGILTFFSKLFAKK